MNIADPTLGLDDKAQIIVKILSTWDPSFAEFNERAQTFEVTFRTMPFYTAVWRWAAIAMTPTLRPHPDNDTKIILFGTAGHHDEIEVRDGPVRPWWEFCDGGFKGWEEKAVSTRVFPPHEYGDAAEYIQNRLAEAYATMRPRKETMWEDLEDDD